MTRPTAETVTLKKAIIAMSAYYRQPLPDETVRMYIEDLDGFTAEEILMAMKIYRDNPANNFMFRPAHLVAIMNPEANNRDIARHTALRIREAVTKFGWSSPGNAREFIGELGWRVVQRFGGWQHLCENLGVEIQESTFIAQARDAIESEVNLMGAGIDTEKPVLGPSKRTGGLEPAGNILKQIAQHSADKVKEEK